MPYWALLWPLYNSIKRNMLISTALEPVTGTNRVVKGTIDILAVIATVMGVATSIGLGVLQTNGGLTFVFGLPDTFILQVAIILIMFIGYMLSATTGLQKGMKILSNVNMTLAIVLLLFVLITGPTIFILETFTLAIGDYISNFIQYSLRMHHMLGNLGEGLDNLLLGMGDCLVTICRLLYSSCIQRQDYTRIYYRCINYSAPHCLLLDRDLWRNCDVV